MANIFKEIKRSSNVRIIKAQGGLNKKLVIKYRKKDGKVVTRTIAPYEIKPHRHSGKPMLYATNNKHGAKQILSLYLDNVLDVKATNKSFRPNWDVTFKNEKIKKPKLWHTLIDKLNRSN